MYRTSYRRPQAISIPPGYIAPRPRTGMDVLPRPVAMPKPMVGAPQFPGQKMGMTFEDMQKFIGKQVRMKGFTFPLATGINSDLAVQLSGSAYMMLGYAFILPAEPLIDNTNYPSLASLQINNEVAFSKVHLAFFSPAFLDNEFYKFVRPLSGQDDIQLSCTSLIAQDLEMIIYYL